MDIKFDFKLPILAFFLAHILHVLCNGENENTVAAVKSLGYSENESVSKIVFMDEGKTSSLELRDTGPCPTRCTCYKPDKSDTDTLFVTNCSNADFSEIPNNIPHLTTHLLLNNNMISNLPNYSFKDLHKMLYLDISKNTLQNLSSLCFYGLSELRILSLSDNRLWRSDACPGEVFQPLLKLETLHIEKNCNYHTDRGCSYHDEAIQQLSQLKYLFMDGIINMAPGPGFNGLKNLEALSMEGMSHPHCHIGNLTRSWIENLSLCPLKHISFLGCHIEVIEEAVMAHFERLEALDLTGNDAVCNNSSNFRNLLSGLNNTNINSLNLSRTCNPPKSFRLSADMFRSLVNTRLETLVMERSYINYIERNLIDVLPQTLKYLSLSRNVCRNTAFLEVLNKLNNLEILDVSNQFRDTVLNQRMHSNEQNDSKSILSSHLETFQFSEDTELCLQEIAKYREARFGKFKQPIVLPPKLRILLTENNKIHYPVPKLVFTPNNSLEYVDGSSNEITGIIGKISGLHALRVLNLSYNKICLIHQDVFVDFENLETLVLSGNNIGYTFLKDKYRIIFSGLTVLKSLDLSQNGIANLPQGMFSNNRHLKLLNLSHNALDKVEFSVHTFIALQTLDLSFNKITTLSKDVMEKLDRKNLNEQLHLNLTGNPLVCTCENLEFIKWLATSKITFTGISKEVCRYTNQTNVLLTDVGAIYNLLQAECVKTEVLIGCIATFFTLLLIMSFVAALNNQRWKIKYLHHIGRRNINPYHPLEEEEINMVYDVYISYPENYMLTQGVSMYEFVTQHVHPALIQRGMRVMIRDDLTSGRMLQEIISSAIRRTKKVLVLLTDNYCKDFWNIFEFNTAAHEGIYTKRNIIIPVMFENLQECNFPPEIWLFLKSADIVRFSRENSFIDFLEMAEYKIQNE